MTPKSLPLFFFAAAALLLQAPAHSAPLVSIGDNTDVFFNGSSTLRYTSNVYRDEDDKVEDVVLHLSPGFEVNVGRGLSSADFSVITRYDIVRYLDRDQLDTELFHIKAMGSYSSSRLDLTGSVSFDESKTSTGDTQLQSLQDLIEFDNFSVRIDGEYRFSPKFSFGTGIDYSEREFTTYEDRFADQNSLRLPFDIFYELTPKIDLSIGYTYSNTEVEGTFRSGIPTGFFQFSDITVSEYEYDSHFFNIGARGNLLPKLTGFFKVGYRVRESDDSIITTETTSLLGPPGSTTTFSRTNRSDNGMLGLNADLMWAATPKISARLGVSRDFGVGGEGEATENSSFDLSANYSINRNFAASATLSYTLREYPDIDREDNQYDAGLRLSYSPSQYWSFSTGYSYVENDSNQNDLSYVNHMLDLSVSLRY